MWGKWIKRLPWPGIILALAVTLVLAAAWQAGHDAGRTEARRDGDKALAQLQSAFDNYKAERAALESAALRLRAERYQEQVAAAHRADADFQAKKQQLERENADLKKQIADVTRHWVDASGKNHPIKCVFTRGFVQQYNAAIGAGDGGVSAATASGSAGNTTGATDTAFARLRDSGVSQADVLANVTDNARQCRVWREQVNALLDYNEGVSR